MQDIVIVAATRTAVGKFGGSLSKVAAPELGAAVIRNLLERTGLALEWEIRRIGMADPRVTQSGLVG